MLRDVYLGTEVTEAEVGEEAVDCFTPKDPAWRLIVTRIDLTRLLMCD